MPKPLRIAGISGSLRKDSYNTAAIRAAMELAPEGVQIELHLLHDIPPFNQDTEAEGWPRAVQHLRERVAAADGLLLATPEYNHSAPGVLMNALDWLARPPGQGPVEGKPLAIIGASESITGTARAQAQLRQYAFYNHMPLVTHAELLIGEAKFDSARGIIDPATREFLASMLLSFADRIRRAERQKAAA